MSRKIVAIAFQREQGYDYFHIGCWEKEYLGGVASDVTVFFAKPFTGAICEICKKEIK